MNLSAFSNHSFSSKEWINSAFQEPEARENKEVHASQVALKLQLLIQEMNSALEETAQQVQDNLSNVLGDVANMQQEVILLKQHMVALEKDIERVERNTSTVSIKTLLRMDTIKARMLRSDQALREADNWTKLSSDIDKVFETGDVQKIAHNLVGLQSSLEVLVGIEDYQTRCQELERLKDRLEAMVSPYLIGAFNSQSVDGAKTYWDMFRAIHRLPQLLKHYRTHVKSRLIHHWHKAVESQTSFFISPWHLVRDAFGCVAGVLVC